jgi:cell shape-determining protein MreC
MKSLKIPADAVTSVAARVIADLRSVRSNRADQRRWRQGIVMACRVDERGLLGRVITTGNYSSRVLL